MAGLSYPLKYEKGMPTAIFTPQGYSFPKALGKEAKPGTPAPLPVGVVGVSLYIPGDYSEQMQSKWGYQELIGGTSGTVEGGAKAMAAEAAAGVVGAKGVAFASAHSGQAKAPLDMSVYQGPEPISLNFSFDLVPVNQAEANAIMNIIRCFKISQFPNAGAEKSAEEVIISYPPIWNIHFLGIKGLSFNKAQKYPDMALTSVQVSYNSGTTNINVFHDENPVQVKLNLSFQAIRKYFAADMA